MELMRSLVEMNLQRGGVSGTQFNPYALASNFGRRPLLGGRAVEFSGCG
jgi:hypothetical protein